MKRFTYSELKDTRSGFGDGLTELGRNNKDVVALCADLTGSLKMNQFKNENPNRFFQVGIAEANMMVKYLLQVPLQIFLLDEYMIRLDNRLRIQKKM